MRIGIAARLLVSIGAGAALSCGAELPETDGWLEVRTRHFDIYSSAGEVETKEIAIGLERFRATLAGIAQDLELPADVTTVYVFRSDREFVPYKRGKSGRPERNLAGYFVERPFRGYIALNAAAGSDSVVFHEYVHAVLNRTLPTIPLWLGEGLADFYGAFRFDVLSNEAKVGSPLEEHMETLSELGTIPLSKLFSPDVLRAASNRRQAVFYAQSWLLVHYLMADDARRACLSRLFSMLRAGRDPDEAVVEALETDPASLLEALERYTPAEGEQLAVVLDDSMEQQSIELRDMPAGEVLYRLGDLLAWNGSWNADAARTHLEAALERGGPVASVRSALGNAAEARRDFEDAARQHRLATETAGADAEVFARSGRFVLEHFLDGDQATRGGQEEIPGPVLEARALLARSLELDPDEFDALVLLGQTYLFGNDDEEHVGPGISALERASTLRPNRLDVLGQLAYLLAESGRTAEAWSLLETRIAPRTAEPRHLREVESWIVRSELARVDARTKEGAVEEATAILADLERRVTDDRWREEIAAYRARLGMSAPVSAGPPDTVLLRQQMEDKQRIVADYNRALGRIASGDHAGALELLDAALTTCTTGELCARMRARADELRARPPDPEGTPSPVLD